MVDDVDGAVVLDERVTRPLQRIAPGLVGELLHALPRPLRVMTRPCDHDPVEGAPGLDFFVADSRAYRRIAETLAHLRRTALVHPVRDRDRETGGRCRVRILVRRDVDPFAASSLYQCCRLFHFAPVLLACRLVMRELGTDA